METGNTTHQTQCMRVMQHTNAQHTSKSILRFGEAFFFFFFFFVGTLAKKALLARFASTQQTRTAVLGTGSNGTLKGSSPAINSFKTSTPSYAPIFFPPLSRHLWLCLCACVLSHIHKCTDGEIAGAKIEYERTKTLHRESWQNTHQSHHHRFTNSFFFYLPIIFLFSFLQPIFNKAGSTRIEWLSEETCQIFSLRLLESKTRTYTRS